MEIKLIHSHYETQEKGKIGNCVLAGKNTRNILQHKLLSCHLSLKISDQVQTFCHLFHSFKTSSIYELQGALTTINHQNCSFLSLPWTPTLKAGIWFGSVYPSPISHNPPPSTHLYFSRLFVKSNLFWTCMHAQCRIHFIHHIEFYFRFGQLISFSVWGQLYCACQGEDSSTIF